MSLEDRVAKLEAAALATEPPEPGVVVMPYDSGEKAFLPGESEGQYRRRRGLADSVPVIVIGLLDARLPERAPLHAVAGHA